MHRVFLRHFQADPVPEQLFKILFLIGIGLEFFLECAEAGIDLHAAEVEQDQGIDHTIAVDALIHVIAGDDHRQIAIADLRERLSEVQIHDIAEVFQQIVEQLLQNCRNRQVRKSAQTRKDVLFRRTHSGLQSSDPFFKAYLFHLYILSAICVARPKANDSSALK